jgi:hypothetical protein
MVPRLLAAGWLFLLFTGALWALGSPTPLWHAVLSLGIVAGIAGAAITVVYAVLILIPDGDPAE